jgi:hypothetical protein
LEAFKTLFKPITDSDIDNYRREYVGKWKQEKVHCETIENCGILGSELEKTDLKKAYVNGKGCINYMMEHIPFMGKSIEDFQAPLSNLQLPQASKTKSDSTKSSTSGSRAKKSQNSQPSPTKPKLSATVDTKNTLVNRKKLKQSRRS